MKRTQSKRKPQPKRRGLAAPAQSKAIVKSEPPSIAEAIEKVLIQGDLSSLNVDQRLEYYKKVCASLGLNPLTHPFAYIVFTENGVSRMQLYALKDCTEQLRKMHGVGVTKLEREMGEEICLVEASVRDKWGKTDVATGVVSLWKFKDGKRLRLDGKELANAIMKAETKAKRRATLSVCGLGFLDESEIDSAEGYNLVSPGGRVIEEVGERGTAEAAQAVATRKLAEHAQGKSIDTPEPIQTESPKTAAKVEEVKAKEVASVKNKTVEFYKAQRDGVEVLYFMRSEALALLIDNGFADITAFEPSVGRRFIAYSESNVGLISKVAEKLGVDFHAIPEQEPEKKSGARGPMAPDPAVIPPMETAKPAESKKETRPEPPADAKGLRIEKILEKEGQHGPYKSIKWNGVFYSCFHRHINEMVHEGDIADFELEPRGKYKNIKELLSLNGKTYTRIDGKLVEDRQARML